MKKLIPVLLSRKALVVACILISCLFCILSYNQGMHEDKNGDYYIYYETGENFHAGKTIYTYGLADGGFVYPPFSAMMFQTVTLLPFHISAVAFSFFVNYVLWVLCIIVLYKILSKEFPGIMITHVVLFASLASARFFWHNFSWMQSNVPVLFSTLCGIYFYIKKKDTPAYLCFWMSTFLKVTPVLFLVFIAFKKGYKTWPKIAAMALPFIILPFLFRGLSQGMQDWVDYFNVFIKPFASGKTDELIISLGIPSMLNKFKTGIASPEFHPLFTCSEVALQWIIHSIQFLLLGSVVFKICILQRKQTRLSGRDFAVLFLLILLLPGRVWEHHHVVTLYIYAYVFILLSYNKYKWMKYIFISVALFIGLVGKDTVGDKWYDLSQYYSLVTIEILFLFLLLLLIKDKNAYPGVSAFPAIHMLKKRGYRHGEKSLLK